MASFLLTPSFAEFPFRKSSRVFLRPILFAEFQPVLSWWSRHLQNCCRTLQTRLVSAPQKPKKSHAGFTARASSPTLKVLEVAVQRDGPGRKLSALVHVQNLLDVAYTKMRKVEKLTVTTAIRYLQCGDPHACLHKPRSPLFVFVSRLVLVLFLKRGFLLFVEILGFQMS